MKAIKILLWLLLLAAMAAGVPFAVMEYQYAREMNRQDTGRVQQAEALLIETLRSDPALEKKFGRLKSLSGKGYHRQKAFISVHIVFKRVASFERGDLPVEVRMARKHEGWSFPPQIKEWQLGANPQGQPALGVSM